MWPDLGPRIMHLMLDWLLQFWEGGGARTQRDPLGCWTRLAWNPCLATGGPWQSLCSLSCSLPTLKASRQGLLPGAATVSLVSPCC